MANIHPTAIVDPQAVIGRDVSIGPYSVIEAAVVLGDGCRLASHVVIKQGSRLGCHNEIHEGTVLGGHPQHLRARDQLGGLVIGQHNTLRENVTIHRGLHPGDDTVVGDHNLIMVNAHIAHDCHVGSHTLLANNVMLAGHIRIQDFAYLSGAVGVHQFCRIGAHAMVGGQAHIKRDVPPYVTVDGKSSQIVGLNLIGLRRHGFGDHELQQLKAAYRVIFRSGMPWAEVLLALETGFPTGPAAAFHPFLAATERGVIGQRRNPPGVTLKLTPQQPPAEPVRKAG